MEDEFRKFLNKEWPLLCFALEFEDQMKFDQLKQAFEAG